MKAHWLKNAIIYQILIDRFAGAEGPVNKPDFLGGNIRGIFRMLDYIHDLGVNTIWLSPFWKTNKYHGYHITDYETVDPHFGSAGDLRSLIKSAHDHSLKIITDFVPNHCSCKHPFFLEAQRNKSCRYYNWFYFKKWPDDYLCFLNEKQLPKLNLENPETCDYMINIAKYWLSLGIDGYRIDHIIGPSHRFWRRFSDEVIGSYPDCAFFGEAWGEGISPAYFETINIRNKWWHKIFGISQESLQLEYSGTMNGILDFMLNRMIIEAVSRGKGFTSGREFRDKVNRHFRKYPVDYYPLTFLDNHDMNRFLYHCKGDYDLLYEALEFLLGSGYPVIIYYGTETGMCNEVPVQINLPHSDLNVREIFEWNETNHPLYKKIKTLINKYARSIN